MTKEEAQRIADNFFQRYKGSTDPEEISSTEYNHRLRDQILDATLSHPTLPSDEEIENWKHSVTDGYGAEMSNYQTPEAFRAWEIGMKQMRSITSPRIAEMEREIKRLQFMIENGLGAKDIKNDI